MRRFILLFSLFAACHPAPTHVAMPAQGDARTAIYVAVGEGRAPMVYVSDLVHAPGLPEIARLPGSTLDLYVVYYACPPEILRIPVGLATLSEEGHPIPGGQASYRSTITDDGQSGWQKIDHPPLAHVKIEREIKCAKFDLTVVELVGTENGYGVWSVPISEDTVLVAVPPIGFWRVSSDHVEEAPELGHLPMSAFFREREDRIWIFGGDNELAVGDPKTGIFELMPALANAKEPRFRAWLTGAPPGAPFELFAFHDSNMVARFDGTSWTKLYEGERPRSGRWDFSPLFGGLLWLGPGDAIAVWGAYENAKHVTTATVTDEMILPANSGDKYTVAANVPGLGPVAGTSEGRAYVRRDNGEWDSYPDAPIAGFFGLKLTAVSPLDDGLLIAGGGGRFTQLQPELRRNDKYCHYENENEAAVEGAVPFDAFARFLVADIQPLGCGYVFLSKAGGADRNVEVGFLKRK
jgi:hypothetical protein